ncbi:hypothetical protein [Ulvibacter antarcticus]|uniref:VWFA domain-containing protein n=1 Tax=Ulvibacter antarcticus TaxID=442714 RepID=A0A3L9Z328_9FLAO|nr:hypothetical protein [Ulvibacter antarcticus]RMA66560.1 hypothetical protein BXY75_0987 [Ulvibacter antarcticus]
MKIQTLLFYFFLFLIIGCQEDKTEKKVDKSLLNVKTAISLDCPKYIAENKQNNLNISILLDLSDRIIDERIVEKDTAYLSSIAETFIAHIKSKKLILLQDRMQLFFNPEPSNGKINEIAKDLQIQFTKNSPKAQISLTEELYRKKPIILYKLAKQDATKPEDYPGSDIWRFFKDDVKDYSISDCHRNILIVLTDGYMYYDKTEMNEKNHTSYLTPISLKKLNLNNSNWKKKIENNKLGFIKANEGLENLEVLVLGVNSVNPENPYTLDIIETYWTNWLSDMGVKKYKVKNSDISSNVSKVIKDFILN